MSDEQIDWQELEETSPPKVLTFRGVDYIFPGDIDGRAWITLRRIFYAAEMEQRARDSGSNLRHNVNVSDADATHLSMQLMGEDYVERLGSVPSRVLVFMEQVLSIWHMESEELALELWAAGPNSDPKDVGAKVLQRRKAASALAAKSSTAYPTTT